ncbi:MAG TPA: ABC transporter permease [Micrococcales bacterium]|uniref:ABC transporter permease n=1 Tax=Miniimonas arenae TaxID=676201 RepID=UPI000ED7BBF8|nr:ABC transporter permease subunit [Miniimonas arenae]HCX84531.1 ABC transporter permease [Micrococcales bacterium]
MTTTSQPGAAAQPTRVPEPRPRPSDPEPAQSAARRALLRAIGRSLLTFLGTLVTVVVIWWGAIVLLDLSSYVAKSPLDVVQFLFTEPDAAENRAVVMDALGITLNHAFIGFVTGLVAAVVGAVLFVLFRPVEQTLMPVAMLLRSVPLIAMAPVIIMIFGRGVATVAVIGGIVVVFPALVNVVAGLKAAPPALHDVVEVYGGSSWAMVRKVSIPAAMPSLFASIRISVPGAITGALLAEWLATGDGLGGTINRAASQVQFDLLWAGVVVVTLAALALYALAQVVENLVLAQLGMLRPGR